MVGPQMKQGLVYGGVELRRDQRVLEAGPLRAVVVNVVGGDHGDADLSGDPGQFPVAVGVPVQEVPLQLDVH